MKHALSRILISSGLLLASCAVPAVHAADAGIPDAGKGEQLYANGDPSRGILACASCHGAAGNSTIPANPNLAAMSHEYIAKQLIDFRPKGENAPPARRGPGGSPTIMTSIAAALSDDDIQNIALYLSEQALDPATAATATNAGTVERGQQIWRGGLPDRRVPACAACHGASGEGIPSEYPRLAGQHSSYLLEQLKLFSSKDRDNSSIMHDIADRMSDPDIAAVADYAAGLR